MIRTKISKKTFVYPMLSSKRLSISLMNTGRGSKKMIHKTITSVGKLMGLLMKINNLLMKLEIVKKVLDYLLIKFLSLVAS